MNWNRSLSLFAATVLLATLAPTRTLAQDPVEIFAQDGDALYVAEVASVSTFENVVLYTVYFTGDAVDASVHTSDDTATGPVFEQHRVARIVSLDNAKAEQITVRTCVGETCRPVPLDCLDEESPCKRVAVLGDQSGLFFVVGGGKQGVQQGEDVRVSVPAGVANLNKESNNTATTSSPALSSQLPQLGERDKSVFASQPIFRFSLSPITESQMEAAEGDDNAASVYFSGGVRRFRPKSVFGLTYSGSFGTEEEISFNRIQADLEYQRNLLRGTYLPLTFSLGAETDQSFELVNAVARVGLEFLLPFNVNYSPPDENYIPNIGPTLRLIGEIGSMIDESAEQAAMAQNPEDFERLGYEARWTVPMAKATVLKLHLAGVWVFSDDVNDDFHDLWDVSLETEIGNLTYYIGYQSGSAAPLFQATETTQAGIVLRFGDRFQCQKSPGSDQKFNCSQPSS